MFDASTGTFAANKVLRELGKSGAVGRTERTVIFPTTKLELGFADPPGVYMSGAPFLAEITEGQKYKVVWNGVEREYTASFNEDVGGFVFGNQGLINPDYPDTGESFMLVIMPPSVDDDGGSVEGGMMAMTHDSAATLSIYTETIHPINPKYLPEGGVGYSETKVLLDGVFTPSEEGLIFTNLIDYKAGDKFTVTWNGVEYTCVAYEFDDGSGMKSVAFGNMGYITGEDDGVPFVHVVMPDENGNMMGGFVPTADEGFGGSVSIKMITEVVHPIEPKYVPGVIMPVVEIETEPNGDGVELSDADMERLKALNGAIPFVAKFSMDGLPIYAVMNGINTIYEGQLALMASGSFRIAPTVKLEAGFYISKGGSILYAYQKSGL